MTISSIARPARLSPVSNIPGGAINLYSSLGLLCHHLRFIQLANDPANAILRIFYSNEAFGRCIIAATESRDVNDSAFISILDVPKGENVKAGNSPLY
jgi:hypothetical protein